MATAPAATAPSEGTDASTAGTPEHSAGAERQPLPLGR